MTLSDLTTWELALHEERRKRGGAMGGSRRSRSPKVVENGARLPRCLGTRLERRTGGENCCQCGLWRRKVRPISLGVIDY